MPDELASALRPRHVAVPVGAGLYESFYFTAHHPVEPKALWVRYTVLKPPGGPARASLWCTWFSGDGVRAGKVTTTDVASTADRPLRVGPSGWIEPTGAEGRIEEGPLRASWTLRFHEPEPPMFHLPKPWMYTAPIPRTKSISAAPVLTLGGTLTVDGEDVDVAGWPCTIGHNWGAEHAERWIWLHADADDAAATATATKGRVWLDVVIGRIRLGPVTTPWIANGALSIDGRRHRLGGVRLRAGTQVVEHSSGATVRLRGSGISVVARSEIDLPRSVAWTYADPAGHTSEVVNSSVARTTLAIRREGHPALELTSPVSAFELGARERTFEVALQPFAD
jgi:hypothetical protein